MKEKVKGHAENSDHRGTTNRLKSLIAPALALTLSATSAACVRATDTPSRLADASAEAADHSMKLIEDGEEAYKGGPTHMIDSRENDGTQFAIWLPQQDLDKIYDAVLAELGENPETLKPADKQAIMDLVERMIAEHLDFIGINVKRHLTPQGVNLAAQAVLRALGEKTAPAHEEVYKGGPTHMIDSRENDGTQFAVWLPQQDLDKIYDAVLAELGENPETLKPAEKQAIMDLVERIIAEHLDFIGLNEKRHLKPQEVKLAAHAVARKLGGSK